jgi:hypothetical protein
MCSKHNIMILILLNAFRKLQIRTKFVIGGYGFEAAQGYLTKVHRGGSLMEVSYAFFTICIRCLCGFYVFGVCVGR